MPPGVHSGTAHRAAAARQVAGFDLQPVERCRQVRRRQLEGSHTDSAGHRLWQVQAACCLGMEVALPSVSNTGCVRHLNLQLVSSVDPAGSLFSLRSGSSLSTDALRGDARQWACKLEQKQTGASHAKPHRHTQPAAHCHCQWQHCGESTRDSSVTVTGHGLRRGSRSMLHLGLRPSPNPEVLKFSYPR